MVTNVDMIYWYQFDGNVHCDNDVYRSNSLILEQVIELMIAATVILMYKNVSCSVEVSYMDYFVTPDIDLLNYNFSQLFK